MRMLLAAVAMIPVVAHAGFLTGNDLLKRMTSDDTLDRIYSIGYLVGVYDASEAENHCAPSGITAAQVRDVVKIYLDRNPEVRNLHADMLVKDALRRAWPCARKRGT